MTHDHGLEEALAWRGDGHVSEEVITALGDGQQQVVPLAAYAHVHNCALCTERLGRAALLGSVLDEVLRPETVPDEVRRAPLAPTPAPLGEPAQRPLAAPVSGRRLPLPVPALAAALVVAALGAAPTVAELGPRIPQIAAALAARLPAVAHTLAVVVRTAAASDGATLGLAWTGAAGVLLLCGLLVTRLLPLQSKGETP